MRTRPSASSSTPPEVRLLIALHACLGIPLLIAPGGVAEALPHQRIDRPVRVLGRILGVRHLLEAAVLARRHSHGWMLAGATIDAAHALTMALLAWLRPAQRRLALTNAAGAALLAAGSIDCGQRAGLTERGCPEAGG